MATKLIYIFLLLVIPANVFSQVLPKLTITASRFGKDSVSLEIKNNTQTSSLRFSIYKQVSYGKKWETNVYDVFCNPSNPSTSILMIPPGEVLNLNIYSDGVLYTTGGSEKTGKRIVKIVMYRYLLKASIEGDDDKICYYYSNKVP
ncbi:hypothetical protein GO495_29990 [Chitinophaga oryziterrae]|uniref:Uncharacterized protein n=1 Tax=Chitinophaga oryziterrae TaxID=1031224 RepID=A0A6N8JK92_9BACT|nr:hypothetical protein [Chitinophaga oryziterrae]MVT44861.1 hypothetical protein [Chitinophaga oryziterrae]